MSLKKWSIHLIWCRCPPDYSTWLANCLWWFWTDGTSLQHLQKYSV